MLVLCYDSWLFYGALFCYCLGSLCLLFDGVSDMVIVLGLCFGYRSGLYLWLLYWVSVLVIVGVSIYGYCIGSLYKVSVLVIVWDLYLLLLYKVSVLVILGGPLFHGYCMGSMFWLLYDLSIFGSFFCFAFALSEVWCALCQ